MVKNVKLAMKTATPARLRRLARLARREDLERTALAHALITASLAARSEMENAIRAHVSRDSLRAKEKVARELAVSATASPALK
jgi:hypothetical protein